MRIENYSERYKDDIVGLATRFYNEALSKDDDQYRPESVMGMIDSLAQQNSENAYLLIEEERCIGILAGFAMKNPYNFKQIWQEVIWYVDPKRRKYGVKLLRHAEEDLKQRGFNTLIMALMESSMKDKVNDLYLRLGYRPYEHHYIRSF